MSAVFYFFVNFCEKLKFSGNFSGKLADNGLYGHNFQGGFLVSLITETTVNKVFIETRHFKVPLEKIEIQMFESVRKQDTFVKKIKSLPVLRKSPVFHNLRAENESILRFGTLIVKKKFY